MLISFGEKDHTVPRAITEAIYDKQKRNTAPHRTAPQQRHPGAHPRIGLQFRLESRRS
jgi:hypothetical protein